MLSIFSSCSLYYRFHKSKAEKAQIKEARKKDAEWKKKDRIREQNKKRIMGMQTKDTRKRMKNSAKKSDRINARKAPKQEKHYQLPRIFKPSRWWRKK